MALSTTKAEYVASTDATCQIAWLRRILQDCGFGMTNPTKLWCDNMSAIVVAKNPTYHGRTKHIDVRFPFIRGLVIDGVISLHHCSTDDQVGDIFTKPLTVDKHIYMRGLLGLCMLQSTGDVGV